MGYVKSEAEHGPGAAGAIGSLRRVRPLKRRSMLVLPEAVFARKLRNKVVTRFSSSLCPWGIRTFSFLEAKSLEPIIEIKNLSKTFGSGEAQVAALQNVSLQVLPGDIFGIIGLSGAGKSTLVRCINLLERPDSGEVLFHG